MIRTVRSSRLSIFQSLVEDLVRGSHPAKQSAEGEKPTLSHSLIRAATVLCEYLEQGKEPPHEPPNEVKKGPGESLAWQCVKFASRLFLAKIEGDEQILQLENDLKDSDCDPGWVEAITAYFDYFGLHGERDPIPYVTYRSMDDFVLDTLQPDARVALVGDWGTGTEDARRVMTQIARHRPDVLIHLGDIYYSGTPRETHANFLAICDEALDRKNRPIPIYTLTGNHDMYAGGQGYYSLLPLLNPSPPYRRGQAQPASFFCLRSADGAWQFLCMDTGLHDHDPFTVSTDVTYLEPSEARWHLDKIDRFSAAGGKTVLLSHHQLFTACDYIGKGTAKPAGQEAYNHKLLETFEAPLKQGKVSAWLWGHEHNLCIYQPYGPLKKGRCVGHGALPVFEAQTPYKADSDIPDPPLLVNDPDTGRPIQLPLDDNGVYRHGYVMIQLDPRSRTAEASYYLETDPADPIYRELLD